MRALIALLLSLLILTGCQTTYIRSSNPFPADHDLAPCTYPMRDSDDDVALGDAYLAALSQIELCNGRLEGVRKAKAEYQDQVR